MQAAGVLDIVGQGSCPEPIPESDIDAIKSISFQPRVTMIRAHTCQKALP